MKRYFGTASTQAIYLVASKRTPIGSFLGSLQKNAAPDLAAVAIKAALAECALSPTDVEEAVIGNVVSAGIGQAPARQAVIKAGLPQSVTCTTINKVCSSGLKSIMYAAQSLSLGYSKVALAGGMQSMSNIPFYVSKHRKGHPFGDQKLIDGMMNDGLVDPYCTFPMGLVAEKTATEMGITREAVDAFAITSYQRLASAIKEGSLNPDIAPVPLQKVGNFSQDQEINNYKKEKIGQLKPAFSKTGINTAGNSSKLSDGASAVVLMTEAQVTKRKIKPLARIVSMADTEISPNDFCIAPNSSIKKALDRAGLSIGQMDFIEINQAFAVAALANMKLLDVPLEKINVWGGAIALGHPIGMSGSRILSTLARILISKKKKYGVAGICNGGGGSSAVVIQSMN